MTARTRFLRTSAERLFRTLYTQFPVSMATPRTPRIQRASRSIRDAGKFGISIDHQGSVRCAGL